MSENIFYPTWCARYIAVIIFSEIKKPLSSIEWGASTFRSRGTQYVVLRHLLLAVHANLMNFMSGGLDYYYPKKGMYSWTNQRLAGFMMTFCFNNHAQGIAQKSQQNPFILKLKALIGNKSSHCLSVIDYEL